MTTNYIVEGIQVCFDESLVRIDLLFIILSKLIQISTMVEKWREMWRVRRSVPYERAEAARSWRKIRQRHHQQTLFFRTSKRHSIRLLFANYLFVTHPSFGADTLCDENFNA